MLRLIGMLLLLGKHSGCGDFLHQNFSFALLEVSI
uniref:Uncharacterized protein n=1 Tax=Rhizophora mucronata TaxID=61149 RepID=A0A2P2PTB2_RHIMU